jgi:hypothetical protein
MNITYPSRALRGLLAFGATLLALGAHAQAPDWQRAIAPTTSPTNWSVVQETATDAAGNVYVAGSFSGTVTFGATTLTTAGGADAFVAKWDPATQAFAWVQQAGGGADDLAYGLAVSGTSVYVSGTFVSPTAAFGPTTLANAGSAPTADMYVAKLTDAGAWVWAQRAGGTGPEGRASVAVSGTSVYVAGTFGGTTAGFGSTTLTNSGLPYTADNYVAKLTDAGSTASWQWVQQFGSPDYDHGYHLVARGSSVYVAGTFVTTATFGPFSLTTAANADLYVAKLLDTGSSASWQWAQRAGGPSNDILTALTVSGSSVYVAGNFDVSMAVGATITFGSTTLSTTGSGDEFVAKLTDTGSAGSWQWAKAAGNPYILSAGSIGALRASGNSLFVLGAFYGTTQAFGSTTLTSAGITDIFVAKITDAGPSASTAWAQRAGGAGIDQGYALALANGTVYAAGSVAPVAAFGTQVIGSAAGSSVGFLASLPDATALASTPAAAALAGLAVYPNPAYGTATVRLPTGLAAGPVALTLLDALGRSVRQQVLGSNAAEATVPLAGLPAGVYVLRAQGAAGTATRRVVVE